MRNLMYKMYKQERGIAEIAMFTGHHQGLPSNLMAAIVSSHTVHTVVDMPVLAAD